RLPLRHRRRSGWKPKGPKRGARLPHGRKTRSGEHNPVRETERGFFVPPVCPTRPDGPDQSRRWRAAETGRRLEGSRLPDCTGWCRTALPALQNRCSTAELSVKLQEVVPIDTQAADGRRLADAGMGPMPVVAMQPNGQLGPALL